MSIPKYQQIRQSLLYEINNGEFEPGDKFYSEAELKEKYLVSRITVIRALTELVDDGYLVRYQGKGTYISKARIGKHVKYTEKEKYTNKKESTKVIKIKKMKDKRIAKELKIDNEASFYLIKRVRFIDGIPIMVQCSYIIDEFIKEEMTIDNKNYTSIYDRFRKDFGMNLFNSDFEETTEIVYPTPDFVSNLLKFSEKIPTSFTCRKTYLFDGRIIEYVESYKHWNYFKIKITDI